MNKLWPFHFFPSTKDDDTTMDALNQEASEVVEAEAAPVAGETVLDDDADTGEDPEEDDVDDDEVVVEDDVIMEEEIPNDEIIDEDDEENLPDLEEELEIALAKAHEEEVAKARTRTKVVAGLTLLGAIGLATGFGIRSYIKKRKN